METLLATKPRLAFAGAGWIGRDRMRAAAASELADIVSITDPAGSCIDEAIKLVPQTRVMDSFESLISDPGIDGVVIATPSALHMQQAVAAFEKGKAVFCQKPLGRNFPEVSKVIDAAKRNDRLLGADFSYRYTKAFTKIHRIIQTGELGKIFAVDLKFHNAYGPDKPWFYDLDQAGGGCALDLGIHLVDLLLYALDFPEVKTVHSSLLAKGVSVKDKNLVEDYANVSIELAEDVTAHLTCSWNLPAGRDAVIKVSFYGTGGGVAFKNINGSFYEFSGHQYRGTKDETIALPPDDWGGRAILDWIRQLAVNKHFNNEAEQYKASAKVLDMIYE